MGLKPEISNQVLTYTLTLSSNEARTDFSIADALQTAVIDYVPGSFNGSIVTRSDAGDSAPAPFPFSPVIAGKSFSGTVTVPAQSTLTITYNVRITDATALQTALQTEFAKLNGAPGDYSVTLTNTVTYGDAYSRSANVGMGATVPGVGIGNNFAKQGNWIQRDVVADEHGKLQPAAPMTYTLHADLTPWDERNPNFTLTQNVVVTDTLIAQASWKTGSDFISVSGVGPVTALTEATGFTGTADDFAADEFVGKYAVAGNTLFVNVGKDKTTKVDIKVLAQLNTVSGLTGSKDPSVVGGTRYSWDNKAQFHYAKDTSTPRDHNANVTVLPEDFEDSGVNDSAAFNKTASNPEIQVKPGERAPVAYRFDIDTAKAQIKPADGRIVDEVNTAVFDITDLDSIPVSGSYDGKPLTREHFVMSVEGENQLMIELSAAGKALVQPLPVGKKWVVDIVLTTVPFDGKETFEIYNKATLNGANSDWDYWSDMHSEATSFGDEAELRKRVFNTETGEWTAHLDALIKDGVLTEDTYIYSIELIPRGNYGQAFPVSVFTREDHLPDAVDFVGFVTLDANGVPELGGATTDPDDMNGNVMAEYANGVVTIRQKDGTNLEPNKGKIVTYFAVKANDASAPIVNKIVDSTATITPVGDPSIDIEKWNDEGEKPAYDASGALLNDGFNGDVDAAPGKPLKANEALPINFTISNDGRENLIDVKVSDKLTDGKGAIADLVCEFPDGTTGTTWPGPFEIGTQFDCSGTLPELAAGDTHVNLSAVTGVGIKTGTEVSDEDPWNGYVPAPSIDIEKWNDEGEAPKFDQSGALLNDGFKGDFDAAVGKKLTAGEQQQLRFTVSNDGAEDLVDVAVSDELTGGKGEIKNLVCTFPDDSTGTEWVGPFVVGTQFECVGMLPALEPGETHSDQAKVTAVGIQSGTSTDDADDWHGFTEPDNSGVDSNGDNGETGKNGQLSNTGSGSPLWIGAGALALIIAGAVLFVLRRKATDPTGTTTE